MDIKLGFCWLKSGYSEIKGIRDVLKLQRDRFHLKGLKFLECLYMPVKLKTSERFVDACIH